MISRRGAEKAIAKIESYGVTSPIDWFIFNYRWEDERGQEDDRITFETYAVKANAYMPIRFLMEAAVYSSVHFGGTESLIS